jgi:hypothetical protein
MKKYLTPFAIGVGILVVIFGLIAMGEELAGSLRKALFLWQDAQGWVKIYSLIGSIVSVYALGYFVKLYFIDNPEEKLTPGSLVILFTVGVLFVTLFIMFGMLFWPIVLWFLYKSFRRNY